MGREVSSAATGSPYSRTIYARWGDMDFNAHMRNTAYLDAAGDLRMSFFADHGFTMDDFQRLQIGPGSSTCSRRSRSTWS
jgi:acyl-CoA thioesterase FadM